jgi:ComF family protein
LEAVFSSSEDQIRASQASSRVAEPIPVSQRTYVWASRAAESLFAVLFPSDCRICSAPLIRISRLPVCDECLDQMVPVRGKVCSMCGERVLSPYAVDAAADELLCPLCHRIEPPFARAAAYGSYESGLRELIHLLKYNGVRPAANILGRMLADAISTLEPAFADAPVLVIPVPLHKTKRRERGFNQAELIARAALKFGSANGRLRLADDLLRRQRETQSQIGLTSHQRRENMRGAFAVNGAETLKGQDVLLVDDVYTTGTTASECARVLRRAGAARVWVATVARTMKMASQYAEIKRSPDGDAEKEAMAKAVAS